MNPVQQKISCVYVTAVTEKSSNKRKYQPFSVTATRNLTEQSKRDDILSATVTEKLDGTCCLVDKFEGHPWLWARHDRKPNKVGERKFAQLKKSIQKERENENLWAEFSWDPSKDFKEVPEHWKPASRLEVKNSIPMPDSIGHTPGWVPVELTSRPYCWHLTAVDFTAGLCLVLREADEEDCNDLVIKSESLSSLCGQTCELIGTNINGNPYNIGSKKCPIHFLVPHGIFPLTCPQPDDYESLYNWFDSSGEGLVEGIVWHCANGELHKLHRHHLSLNWPIPKPKLCCRKVRVQVEHTPSGTGENAKNNLNLFCILNSLNGQTFDSVQDLHKGVEIVYDATS